METSIVSIDDPVQETKNREMIENISSLICKSFGNETVGWFNNYFDPKISGQTLTIEEYSKLVNRVEYFKIISACVNQRNLRRISFWVFFWSVLSILSLIGATYILIKTGVLLDLFVTM